MISLTVAGARARAGHMLLVPILGAVALLIVASGDAAAQPAPANATQGEARSPAMRAWTQRTSARITKTAYRLAGAAHGRPVVQFAVDRQGRVIGSRIVESSGNPHLDGAALAVIQMAGPFGPLPSTYPKDTMVLVQPLRFEIRTDAPDARPGRRSSRRQS